MPIPTCLYICLFAVQKLLHREMPDITFMLINVY